MCTTLPIECYVSCSWLLYRCIRGCNVNNSSTPICVRNCGACRTEHPFCGERCSLYYDCMAEFQFMHRANESLLTRRAPHLPVKQVSLPTPAIPPIPSSSPSVSKFRNHTSPLLPKFTPSLPPPNIPPPKAQAPKGQLTPLAPDSPMSTPTSTRLNDECGHIPLQCALFCLQMIDSKQNFCDRIHWENSTCAYKSACANYTRCFQYQEYPSAVSSHLCISNRVSHEACGQVVVPMTVLLFLFASAFVVCNSGFLKHFCCVSFPNVLFKKKFLPQNTPTVTLHQQSYDYEL